ncbi:MAG TPA: GspE/PulE family protein [Candidatus Paceibacterota bacterium]|nr:GspE/PulE family protein [Candidatus Paceibacterota bacterium]
MPEKEGTTIDIGELLVRNKYLSEDDVRRAREISAARDTPLRDVLLGEGFITRDLLGQAAAEDLGIPYADLNSRPPTQEMLERIPADVARKFSAVLYEETDDSVTVASDEPLSRGLSSALAESFNGKKVRIAYGLPEDIEPLLRSRTAPLSARLSRIRVSEGALGPQIVGELIGDALRVNASDIHLEPQNGHMLVRFRVDGVMHEAVRLRREVHPLIVNRVKVLARMRLDDHFSAQDGAIRYAMEDSSVDIRVSIVPTLDGEKIVMRLLTGRMRSLALTELGLSGDHQRMLESAIAKPFGLILTTGPTGSGKTTTLYASLKTLDRTAMNITTIEDPVEYRLSGINQLQVNVQTGLTFGTGLRAIVRQNPDIIMVGEIRDRETAEVAVNAALTGHMVFSTFHANDAATAAVRLTEIGIEPFLLSSTLELIIAQRLVRRICESCRVSAPATAEAVKRIAPEAQKFLDSRKYRLYRGKGCPVCNGIGYRGRISLFELIPVTRKMRELLVGRPTAQQIWKLAQQEGARSMFEDGMDKVKNGTTTLEEVVRVANPAS